MYFGGQRIAKRDPVGDVFYYFTDEVGTTRAMAEVVPAGTMSLCYDADYYPYGGIHAAIVDSCEQRYKFTGQERDTESNLDNFKARYMASVMMRFTSPDPSGLAFADLSNPQSLNLYAYVLNNPEIFVDPFGYAPCDITHNGAEGDTPTNGGSGDSAGCSGYEGQEGQDAQKTDEESLYYNGLLPSSGGTLPPIPVSMGCLNCSSGPDPTNSQGGSVDGTGWHCPFCAQMDEAGWRPSFIGPQNGGTPWFENACVTDALKEGAVSLGVDAIGFIPEAGGVARIIGHQAGYVGKVADQFGSNIIRAAGKTAGFETSAIGFSVNKKTYWVSAAITVADFIPVVNEFTAAASVAWDLGVTAYNVSQCSK